MTGFRCQDNFLSLLYFNIILSVRKVNAFHIFLTDELKIQMAPPMKIWLETEMRQRLSMPPTSRGEIVSRHFLSNSKRTCFRLACATFYPFELEA